MENKQIVKLSFTIKVLSVLGSVILRFYQRDIFFLTSIDFGFMIGNRKYISEKFYKGKIAEKR